MAHAIRFHQTGGPEVLRLEQVEAGEPGPGQARVRHKYVAVNFIDIYFRTGRYPMPLPNGLGSDAVGIVEAVGPGVTDVKEGDRVGYLLGPQGAYADVRVSALAHDWGSRLVDIGEAGHLNPASGYGPWPLAHAFIEQLAQPATARA